MAKSSCGTLRISKSDTPSPAKKKSKTHRKTALNKYNPPSCLHFKIHHPSYLLLIPSKEILHHINHLSYVLNGFQVAYN
jgi:hypothetical protein